MQLKDVMTREVDGVTPGATIVEALEKLRASEGEPLPVYEDDRLVGVLTEHQIVEWEASGGRDPSLSTVGDAMKRDVAYCYEDQDTAEAVRLMREKGLDGLVVLRRPGRSGERPRPVGVVSLADLATGQATETRGDGRTEVAPPARISLQPIAPPSILGLYGFAGATFIVAAHMAGWYGGANSPLFLFPFAAFFGGLAQFLAGMWSYRARDGLATAMHGMWGAFWMAYGLLFLLGATGSITLPTGAGFAELGFWFIVLALITWVGAWAALARNGVLTGVLGFLALGSTLAAIGFLGANSLIEMLAGWSFVISAVIAFYLASAMMLEGSYGKVILPLGGYRKELNAPGRRPTRPVEYAYGEPGVRAGQ